MSDNQQHQDHNGSFTGGFTLGLFAGAIGYFLMATDKGKDVREELEKEWQVAKDKLAEEGVIESSKTSLKDMVMTALSAVAGQDWQSKPTKKKTTRKKKTTKTSTATSKAKKFKNT